MINNLFWFLIIRLYSLIINQWYCTTILIILKCILFLLNDFLFLILYLLCYFWSYPIFGYDCINWYHFLLIFRNYLLWLLFIHLFLFIFLFKIINEYIAYFLILKFNIRNFQILRRINVFLTWS